MMWTCVYIFTPNRTVSLSDQIKSALPSSFPSDFCLWRVKENHSVILHLVSFTVLERFMQYECKGQCNNAKGSETFLSAEGYTRSCRDKSGWIIIPKCLSYLWDKKTFAANHAPGHSCPTLWLCFALRAAQLFLMVFLPWLTSQLCCARAASPWRMLQLPVLTGHVGLAQLKDLLTRTALLPSVNQKGFIQRMNRGKKQKESQLARMLLTDTRGELGAGCWEPAMSWAGCRAAHRSSSRHSSSDLCWDKPRGTALLLGFLNSE